MRTTLDIADDVLCPVQERARREGRSSGEVLSELARDALLHHGRAGEVEHGGDVCGFEPLPHRGAAVSNELIDRLREDDHEG